MNWLQKASQLVPADWSQEDLLRDIINRHGIEQTPDGMIIMYHRTKASRAKIIRQSGFFKSGTYFTNDPGYAEHAGSQTQGQGKVVVMKVKIEPNPEKFWFGIHWTSRVDVPLIEIQ